VSHLHVQATWAMLVMQATWAMLVMLVNIMLTFQHLFQPLSSNLQSRFTKNHTPWLTMDLFFREKST
jgi:hypothetical protein